MNKKKLRIKYFISTVTSNPVLVYFFPVQLPYSADL